MKIEVTGETTFNWVDAKYHAVSATSSCRKQETFSESCFHGSSVSKGNYDVQLVASSGSGKSHCQFVIDSLNGNWKFILLLSHMINQHLLFFCKMFLFRTSI